MVVAAAILAFALRADLSKDYKAALDELAALKETPFGNWVTFIAERYSTSENENDKFVRDIVQRASLPPSRQSKTQRTSVRGYAALQGKCKTASTRCLNQRESKDRRIEARC